MIEKTRALAEEMVPGSRVVYGESPATPPTRPRPAMS